ncbi:MAG: enoyl-CoA hydratase-related protein [Actinocatenispora sp.]
MTETSDAATPLVRYDVVGGVATLTMDSDANRNALSRRLISEMLAGLRRAMAEDTVRAVLIDHVGRVFCSGADLAETAAARATGEVPAGAMPELLAEIWDAPKPVVARVGGSARAGGLGLIAACDLAVADEAATFAFTEVRLGVIPAVISAPVLRRLPARAASELYLTGEVFDGHRAAQLGLVTTAVPADEVTATVERYLAALLRGAPEALAGAKGLLHRQPLDPIRADLDELAQLSVRYFQSDEGREGVAAFREKRNPAWVPTEAR